MAAAERLKHMLDLSDEALCDRSMRECLFPVLLREGILRRRLPFDRSSLTRWRQRMGEAKLSALIQESLAVATRTEALKPKDLVGGVFGADGHRRR